MKKNSWKVRNYPSNSKLPLQFEITLFYGIKKSSLSQRERIQKNMAQMSCKFGEIIKKL
jgi:hypothetical protein